MIFWFFLFPHLLIPSFYTMVHGTLWILWIPMPVRLTADLQCTVYHIIFFKNAFLNAAHLIIVVPSKIAVRTTSKGFQKIWQVPQIIWKFKLEFWRCTTNHHRRGITLTEISGERKEFNHLKRNCKFRIWCLQIKNLRGGAYHIWLIFLSVLFNSSSRLPPGLIFPV